MPSEILDDNMHAPNQEDKDAMLQKDLRIARLFLAIAGTLCVLSGMYIRIYYSTSIRDYINPPGTEIEDAAERAMYVALFLGSILLAFFWPISLFILLMILKSLRTTSITEIKNTIYHTITRNSMIKPTLTIQFIVLVGWILVIFALATLLFFFLEGTVMVVSALFLLIVDFFAWLFLGFVFGNLLGISVEYIGDICFVSTTIFSYFYLYFGYGFIKEKLISYYKKYK